MTYERKNKFEGYRVIIIGFGLSLSILITIFIYLANIEDINVWDIIWVILMAIIVLGASWFIFDRLKSIKAGLPAEDERMKLAGYKAGYFAYISTIWIAFICASLKEDWITPGVVAAIIVIFPGLIFIISSLFFIKKGV